MLRPSLFRHRPSLLRTRPERPVEPLVAPPPAPAEPPGDLTAAQVPPATVEEAEPAPEAEVSPSVEPPASPEPRSPLTEQPKSPDWEREFQSAIADEVAPISPNGANEDVVIEDPLAEVIQARRNADEAEGDERNDDEERRATERSTEYQARRLRLNYFGRLLGARLVDYSGDGLGVEALSPLPVGAEIGVSGEIVAEDRVIALEGRARVRHCTSSRDGVCRIGFSISADDVKELSDPETFKRR